MLRSHVNSAKVFRSSPFAYLNVHQRAPESVANHACFSARPSHRLHLRRELVPQPDRRGLRPAAWGTTFRRVQCRLAPSGKINANAVEVMRESGFDLTRQRSKGVADLGEAEFDAIVTMGCGDDCPTLRKNSEKTGTSPTQKTCRRTSFARFAI